MTPQEILEYNKRCAEFLGGKNRLTARQAIVERLNKDDWWLPYFGIKSEKQMKFHSDWNWIMKVVEAIEKDADWTLECLNYSDGNRDYQMMIPLSNTNVIFKTKKEAVVEAINQFLIWYGKEEQ